jgi:hypothetical protein
MTYKVTIEVTPYNTTDLWNAACEWMAECGYIGDAIYEQIGTPGEEKIDACIGMVIDRLSIAGCDMNSIDIEPSMGV